MRMGSWRGAGGGGANRCQCLTCFPCTCTSGSPEQCEDSQHDRLMCSSGAQRHGNQGEEGKGDTNTKVERDGLGRFHRQPDSDATGLSSYKQVRVYDCGSGRCGERGSGHRQAASHVGTDTKQDFLICSSFSAREW